MKTRPQKLALAVSLIAIATFAQNCYDQAGQVQQPAPTGDANIDALAAEKAQKWGDLLEQLGDHAMAMGDALTTAINKDDPTVPITPPPAPAAAG